MLFENAVASAIISASQHVSTDLTYAEYIATVFDENLINTIIAIKELADAKDTNRLLEKLAEAKAEAEQAKNERLWIRGKAEATAMARVKALLDENKRLKEEIESLKIQLAQAGLRGDKAVEMLAVLAVDVENAIKKGC